MQTCAAYTGQVSLRGARSLPNWIALDTAEARTLVCESYEAVNLVEAEEKWPAPGGSDKDPAIFHELGGDGHAQWVAYYRGVQLDQRLQLL